MAKFSFALAMTFDFLRFLPGSTIQGLDDVVDLDCPVAYQTLHPSLLDLAPAVVEKVLVCNHRPDVASGQAPSPQGRGR